MWQNGIIFATSAVDALIGPMDIGESADSYFFGITLPGMRVSFIHPVKYGQILNLELLAIIVVRKIFISK